MSERREHVAATLKELAIILILWPRDARVAPAAGVADTIKEMSRGRPSFPIGVHHAFFRFRGAQFRRESLPIHRCWTDCAARIDRRRGPRPFFADLRVGDRDVHVLRRRQPCPAAKP